jgi:hypothetical protein
VIILMENIRKAWYLDKMDIYYSLINTRSEKSIVSIYNGKVDHFRELIISQISLEINPDINQNKIIDKFYDKSLAFKPIKDVFAVITLIDPSKEMDDIVSKLLYLHNLYYYESNNLTIKKYIISICNQFQKQLSIILTIFMLIQETRNIQEIPLSVDIQEQQIYSIIKRHNIIHIDFDIYKLNDCLFCPKCKELKYFISGITKEKKLRKKISTAMGHHDIVFDYHRNVILCKCKKIKKIKNSKQTKLITIVTDCSETICQRLSLFGNLIVFYGKLFMVCHICGIATNFDFYKWIGNKFHCDQCYFNKNKRDTLKLCTFCKIEPCMDNTQFYIYKDKKISSGGLCVKHYKKRLNLSTKSIILFQQLIKQISIMGLQKQ